MTVFWEVVEVQSLDEVAELGREKLPEKLCFYNRAFRSAGDPHRRRIRRAVDQRARGASRAAEFRRAGHCYSFRLHHHLMINPDRNIDRGFATQNSRSGTRFQSADKLTDALKTILRSNYFENQQQMV